LRSPVAIARFDDRGVDRTFNGQLLFPDGLLAQFDSSLTAAILDGTPPRVDLDFSRGNCATLVGLDAAARSHALTRSG